MRPFHHTVVPGETLRTIANCHGRSLEGVRDAAEELALEQPVLASCYAASAGDVQLLGAAPGQKTAKLVQPVRRLASPSEPLAEVGEYARGEHHRGGALEWIGGGALDRPAPVEAAFEIAAGGDERAIGPNIPSGAAALEGRANELAQRAAEQRARAALDILIRAVDEVG